MTGKIPDNPKIYHITHIKNLPGIIEAGVVWSEAKGREHCISCKVVGMSGIKARRLQEIEVKCHPGAKVGDYVPFYFCPRSVMLYLLHRGNHPELDYHEGQEPIIHLEADLRSVVAWAELQQRPWAFSDGNASTYYVAFFNDLFQLDKVNWEAVKATNWREQQVKEGKQAEFLLYESFPLELVSRIGVYSQRVYRQVQNALAAVDPRPIVEVIPAWYY